jgi:hypothetical protein
VLTFGVLAPSMYERGRHQGRSSYKADRRQWSVWPGAAILVVVGLTSFALQWRSVVAQRSPS